MFGRIRDAGHEAVVLGYPVAFSVWHRYGVAMARTLTSAFFSAAAALFGVYLLVAVITSNVVAMELPVLAASSHILEFVLLIAVSITLGVGVVSAGEQI